MDNMQEYKVEIMLIPHPWDNQKQPHFWCIFEWGNSDWCNSGMCGWAKSPIDAFHQAMAAWRRHQNNELRDKFLKCAICGELVENKPSILEEHLVTVHMDTTEIERQAATYRVSFDSIVLSCFKHNLY
jgi:hypothetical protein